MPKPQDNAERYPSIVAVHGLDYKEDAMHAENTWTAANDNMRVKDCLPKYLPRTRVLLLRYDANTAFNPASLDVSAPAEKLLEHLIAEHKVYDHLVS